MPLIDGDFAELLYAVACGRLGDAKPQLTGKHSVTIDIAAKGYPGTPASGGLIGEIGAAEQVEGVTVFHAGTMVGDQGLAAKGGRVLAITAVADTFANARARAYRAVDQIDFADGFHRRDIGWRELARAGVYFADHPRSTFFYLATALHGAHLIGGIALVFYLVIRSLKRALPLITAKDSTWTSIVGLYWHTMDGIWLWLFGILLIFK